MRTFSSWLCAVASLVAAVASVLPRLSHNISLSEAHAAVLPASIVAALTAVVTALGNRR